MATIDAELTLLGNEGVTNYNKLNTIIGQDNNAAAAFYNAKVASDPNVRADEQTYLNQLLAEPSDVAISQTFAIWDAVDVVQRDAIAYLETLPVISADKEQFQADLTALSGITEASWIAPNHGVPDEYAETLQTGLDGEIYTIHQIFDEALQLGAHAGPLPPEPNVDPGLNVLSSGVADFANQPGDLVPTDPADGGIVLDAPPSASNLPNAAQAIADMTAVATGANNHYAYGPDTDGSIDDNLTSASGTPLQNIEINPDGSTAALTLHADGTKALSEADAPAALGATTSTQVQEFNASGQMTGEVLDNQNGNLTEITWTPGANNQVAASGISEIASGKPVDLSQSEAATPEPPADFINTIKIDALNMSIDATLEFLKEEGSRVGVQVFGNLFGGLVTGVEAYKISTEFGEAFTQLLEEHQSGKPMSDTVGQLANSVGTFLITALSVETGVPLPTKTIMAGINTFSEMVAGVAVNAVIAYQQAAGGNLKTIELANQPAVVPYATLTH